MTFTPEQVEDFVACMDNPLRFMNHLEVQYNPDALMAMHANRNVLCKIDDITGLLYVLHQSCFRIDHQAGILAPTEKEAIGLLEELMTYCDRLPEHIRPVRLKGNYKRKVEFENGSQIGAYGPQVYSTQGKAFSLIYFDSFGCVPGNVADHFFQSIYPVIHASRYTKTIINKGTTHFDSIWKSDAFVKVTE